MIPEQQQEALERGQRDITWAMHGGCNDYYCDCHLLLPDALAALTTTQAQLAAAAARLGGLERVATAARALYAAPDEGQAWQAVHDALAAVDADA